MDLQTDIKWIQQELNKVRDENLIEAIKNLLYFRNNTKNTPYQIPDEHIKILNELIAEHQSNPNSGKRWEQVKADLQSKSNEL